MRGPAGGNPALDRLLDEAELLRERLHRVTIALAITEEMLADTFDRRAGSASAHTARQRLEAKRARVAAEECRAFAARLEQLMPTDEINFRDGSASSPS